MIWGVAVNDWFGPQKDPRPPDDNFPELTLQNIDRGKMQVLVTAYDLPSYRVAFEAGAFFAVVEDNAIKNAYPQVTSVSVSTASIELTTANTNEVVTWIGNGEIVGSGMSLWLDDLPSGLKYVRAEIDDLQGRRVFTQPFSLEADQDGDGIPDTDDNCPNDPNGPLAPDPEGGADQADTDGDGIGDACDLYIPQQFVPAARVGNSYSHSLTFLRGTPPVTWSITGGFLPANLTLGSDGVISGNAISGGFTATFTVQVIDSNGDTAVRQLKITARIPNCVNCHSTIQ
jgi:hypothetical protein